MLPLSKWASIQKFSKKSNFGFEVFLYFQGFSR